MAFSISRPRFPRFRDSKNYFKTGIGGEDLRIAAAPPAAGGPTGTTTVEPAPTSPATQPGATGGGALSPTTTYTAPPVTPETPYEPITLGHFGETGTTIEKLFDPSLKGLEAGQMQLGEFADIFREKAGPERTYQDIGAEETLGAAIAGGPMEPAKGLVGAQYLGPTTLDPTGVGGLQHLAGQLKTREEALGTGLGVTSTLQAGIPGLSPGEAKYTAQHGVFSDPTYRDQLAKALGPTGAFGEQVTTEREAAEAYAGLRGEQEADIAQQSKEYLTGQQAGITGDIQGQIDKALAEQATTAETWAQIQGAPDFEQQLEGLTAAQEMGILPQNVDLTQLDTDARKALKAASGLRDEIMAEYSSVSGYALGVPGVGKRGLGSPHVRDPQTGELRDYRDVIPKELQKDWTARQAKLEKAFNPLRQKWMDKYPEFDPNLPEGIDPGLMQTVSPLYYGGPEGGALFGGEAFGGQFQGPQLANFLQFDPGVMPSRGNVSTTEQRDQFNRISDLLDSLDRIEKDDLFHAATIGVNIEQYLDAEADALEAQGEKLGVAGQSWKKQVATLRKKAKKAAKKAEWAKVGQVAGGVLGAVVGSVAGPGGTVIGTGIGSQLGGQLGGSLA